ncbi:16016_t:CDS:1 [Funneliformis caledonium]|uniref:16016_t:CDS:1 n=1 Tax=Funneliformis caledonium TaxID=1117310 RepID=A0A9N9FKS5_9GLOM|nr:16016_t:CDS:1 [Funneliformis caledonium]
MQESNIRININNDSLNDKIAAHNDPFYKLIENQAKEFKEFGKQMSLDLYIAYKEHLNQDEEIIKMEKESKNDCECKEQIIAQEQLIDSLRARIEELETDSIIKNQDIKKLRQDFIDFKKSILENKQSIQVQDIKSSVPSLNDENSNEPLNSMDNSDILHMGTSEIKEEVISSLYIDDTLTTSNKEKFVEPSTPFQQQYYKEKTVEPSTPFKEYNENTVYPSIPFQQYNGEVSTPFQQHNKNFVEPSAYFQHYNEEPSTYFQQYNEEFYEPSTSSYQNNETFTEVPTLYHDDNVYYNNVAPKSFADTWFSISSSASIRNQQKPKQKQAYSTQQNFEQKLEEPISANQKVFAEITKVLEVDGARKVPTKFSVYDLLEYEKSKEFRSLNAKSKSAVKFRINVMLRDELSKNNKLSQPISIYAERGMIPELPKGIKSYSEFQKSPSYDSLSAVRKQRINKVISNERQMMSWSALASQPPIKWYNKTGPLDLQFK